MDYNEEEMECLLFISFFGGKMNESQYQAKVIRKLRDLFPGCIILKNDPTYMQGVPDILILYEHQWAMLEVKYSEDAKLRPNQEYWIERLGYMSFASFINPQNEEQVLHDLQHAFGTTRETRFSQSEQLPLA